MSLLYHNYRRHDHRDITERAVPRAGRPVVGPYRHL